MHVLNNSAVRRRSIRVVVAVGGVALRITTTAATLFYATVS